MYNKVRTTIIRVISIRKEYLIYVSILFSVRSAIGDKVVLQHIVAVGEQRFNRRMSRVQRPVRIEKECKMLFITFVIGISPRIAIARIRCRYSSQIGYAVREFL